MCCNIPVPEVFRETKAVVDSEVPELPQDFYFQYPRGQGPWFTCRADAEAPPKLAKEGVAGPETPVCTLPQLLIQAAEKKGNKDALLVERPCPPLDGDGKPPPPLPRQEWKTWSIADYNNDVLKLAKAFIKLGFQRFDTVNIWGFNSPEWFISTMAGMCAGGKSAGIYPTDTQDTAGYKVVHSGGVISCVEAKAHVDKIAASLNQMGNANKLKGFVAWGFKPAAGDTIHITGCGKVPIFHWDAALEMGIAQSSNLLDSRLAATKPGNCAGLIYTSGTTGDPKAVMMSHDNIVYMCNTMYREIADSCGFTANEEEERVLSYLPLSHVAGLATDLTGPVVGNALTKATVAVFFARPYDLKTGTIRDRLSIARPTVFLGVPLVWEKMADKIKAMGAASTGLKKKMGAWAKGKALEHAKSINLGGSGAKPLGHRTALKVLSAIKKALGLDCCKWALTGAAPIRTDTLEYYGSLGIYINEVYGMSEAVGLITMSTDPRHQWGSCGYQIRGVQCRIFKVDTEDINIKTECPRAPSLTSADDEFQGEICFRGRNVMMGYMACLAMGIDHVQAVNKKTAEAIDADGWMHSGDKGIKTNAGMIKITGRYKELIIGDGGENIAPVPIEDSVKSLADAVMECMMVGDRRKYNVALITLKAVGGNGETPGTDELEAPGKRVDPKITTISQAMEADVFIKYIQKAIDITNANGKVCLNNTFKIQKFTILPANFSEQMGELTPTKKLKRGAVASKYSKLIDYMYQTEGKYIAFKSFE